MRKVTMSAKKGNHEWGEKVTMSAKKGDHE